MEIQFNNAAHNAANLALAFGVVYFVAAWLSQKAARYIVLALSIGSMAASVVMHFFSKGNETGSVVLEAYSVIFMIAWAMMFMPVMNTRGLGGKK